MSTLAKLLSFCVLSLMLFSNLSEARCNSSDVERGDQGTVTCKDGSGFNVYCSSACCTRSGFGSALRSLCDDRGGAVRIGYSVPSNPNPHLPGKPLIPVDSNGRIGNGRIPMIEALDYTDSEEVY